MNSSESLRLEDNARLAPLGHHFYPPEDLDKEDLLDEDLETDYASVHINTPEYHAFMSDLDDVVDLLSKWVKDGKLNTDLRGDWMEGTMIKSIKKKMRIITDAWAVHLGHQSRKPKWEKLQMKALHDSIRD
jgi:hypothetical protein